MNTSLLNKTLNEDSYEEYIDKIINIFKLSSKESSIILNLKIKDYNCLINLSIVSQNGEKEEFSDTTFKCDQAFYKNFLYVLVKKFSLNIKISTKDIVNLDNDSLVTFRIITENNDLLIIDGLSDDHAKYLLSLTEENENILMFTDNEIGIGNMKIFTYIFLVLFIILILIFFVIYKK